MLGGFCLQRAHHVLCYGSIRRRGTRDFLVLGSVSFAALPIFFWVVFYLELLLGEIRMRVSGGVDSGLRQVRGAQEEVLVDELLERLTPRKRLVDAKMPH